MTVSLSRRASSMCHETETETPLLVSIALNVLLALLGIVSILNMPEEKEYTGQVQNWCPNPRETKPLDGVKYLLNSEILLKFQADQYPSDAQHLRPSNISSREVYDFRVIIRAHAPAGKVELKLCQEAHCGIENITLEVAELSRPRTITELIAETKARDDAGYSTFSVKTRDYSRAEYGSLRCVSITIFIIPWLLALCFLVMTIGAIYYFVRIRKKEAVFDEWCPRVTKGRVTHLVNNTADGQRYFVTRRDIYKTKDGRTYIFVLYHERTLYAFIFSIRLDVPVDIKSTKMKEFHRAENFNDRQEEELFRRLLREPLSKGILEADNASLDVEADWYIHVTVHIEERTYGDKTAYGMVEANICAENSGCHLKNFAFGLEDVFRTRAVNITEIVLPERKGDRVFERATVFLSCNLYDGNRKLCSPDASFNSVVKC
ncbi:uncharacterized protein LOC100903831 [Galendromus occidentalis]|uniref:Uncharacterized protein LOC100903831 n=1 Tax=Galendromus occidentalis TaxID=34638 RepID=A0AAJ7L5C8_9ACAR|nr:uncharacterized protein LOC100903831 [Galendromus occidentalis]